MLTEANVEGDTRWVSVVMNHVSCALLSFKFLTDRNTESKCILVFPPKHHI